MDKLYTPEEVAEILKVSVITVKKWLRSGELKGIKVGKFWRIREEDLEEFLRNILKKMELKFKIKKVKKDNNILLSVEGENLGRIIGYNGKTLSALEFILRLYGARLGIQGVITLDIDHYRERREFQLINLAKKIAKRVKEEKRKIALNPLPARERRIIHIALQEDPFVYTYSEGEEPKRRVIIAPKDV
ncbi:MAG: helix-turn-helix domain-containing protein [Candidatus Pacearchaeota archaeon]